MEAVSRPRPDTPGGTAPPNVARDFVTVDDSEEFSYHRSEQDLIADFEYVREAACIINRNGTAFDLALDPHCRLVLGPEHGPVEFHLNNCYGSRVRGLRAELVGPGPSAG